MRLNPSPNETNDASVSTCEHCRHRKLSLVTVIIVFESRLRQIENALHDWTIINAISSLGDFSLFHVSRGDPIFLEELLSHTRGTVQFAVHLDTKRTTRECMVPLAYAHLGGVAMIRSVHVTVVARHWSVTSTVDLDLCAQLSAITKEAQRMVLLII